MINMYHTDTALGSLIRNSDHRSICIYLKMKSLNVLLMILNVFISDSILHLFSFQKDILTVFERSVCEICHLLMYVQSFLYHISQCSLSRTKYSSLTILLLAFLSSITVNSSTFVKIRHRKQILNRTEKQTLKDIQIFLKT